MDPGVEIAWAGTPWLLEQQRADQSRRCAVVAFGAEYGKLLRPVEARISEFLAQPEALAHRDARDPWAGFCHSACPLRLDLPIAGSRRQRLPIWTRAAKCRKCRHLVAYLTSNKVLQDHRKRCPL